MTQVFISYSRKDLEFVDRLANDLKSTGFEIWYDLSGLEAGTRWGNEIQKAIHESQYFLVVLSPNSIKSDWVEREFLYASDQGLKIIPILYQPCNLPIWTLNLHFIDMQGKNYAPNYQELLKILGVAPESVEENPIAIHYIKIGDEYRKRGQSTQAIDSYRQALSVDPANLKAQANIGAVHLSEGAYEEAAAAFEQALQLSNEDLVSRAGFSEANLALGNQARAEGRMDDAQKYYLENLRIDPADEIACQSLAKISTTRAESLLADGQEEEALLAFSEAVQYTPQDQALRSRLEKLQEQKKTRRRQELVSQSEVEISSGNLENGLALLNQALEVDPQDASVRKKIETVQSRKLQQQLESLLAKVDQAEKAGQWDVALAGLKETLQLKPDDLAIQKRMTDLMRSKKAAWLAGVKVRVDQALENRDWQAAQAALQEALQLEPDNTELLTRLETVQQDQHKAEVNALCLRADQAAAAGRWDEAISLLARGQAGFPGEAMLSKKLEEIRRAKHASIHQTALRLADVAARAGKWETAYASLNEVLVNEPDNAEFLQKRDQVLALERASKLKVLKTKTNDWVKAEKFEEALAFLNEAITREPENRQAILDEIELVLTAQKRENDYQEGVQAFAAKNYQKAMERFNGILLKQAGYKDTAKLLVKAGRMQRSAQASPSRSGNKRLWWGIGAVLVVLALGVTALVTRLGKGTPPAAPGQVPSETSPASTQDTSTPPAPTQTASLSGKTRTVTSVEDSGPGTLRQAILDARTGDIITFDQQVFPPEAPATIYLTSAVESGSEGLGGLPRFVQNKITIDASNAGVILDGSKIQGTRNGIILSTNGNTIMGLQIQNFDSCIYLEGGSNNTIGGDRNIGAGPVGQGNVLINCYAGIDILGTSGGNLIKGNIIGTDVNGSESLGNKKAGIWFEGDPPFNTSRTIVGPDNIIVNNGDENKNNKGSNFGGIVIASEQVAVTITENSIVNNAGPGITYSDVWDPVQFVYSTPPTILYFELDPGLVAGSTCPNCTVEIFSNYGKEYEGTVTADPLGNFIFRKNGALAESFLTATTRFPGENTSEYSNPTPESTEFMIALDQIQGRNPPDYQTSFDIWENWGNDPYAGLNNGKLIIASQGPHVSLAVSQFSSDRMMISFEFSILEVGSNNSQCYFEVVSDSLGDSHRELAANFNYPGGASMQHYDAAINDLPSIAESYFTYDITQLSNATLVILGDQIGVFVNGQLAYTAIDPEGSVIYSKQNLSADQSGVCQFDNYKFWNLSGVNLTP